QMSAVYGKILSEYIYYSIYLIQKASVILTDDCTADSLVLKKSFNADPDVLYNTSIQKKLVRKVDGVIETAKNAVIDIIIPIIGIMALFMGFLAIAERAGGVRFISRIIGPFFSKVFPEIPKGHESIGHMMMNFSANLL